MQRPRWFLTQIFLMRVTSCWMNILQIDISIRGLPDQPHIQDINQN
jgi:hypothetical protein